MNHETKEQLLSLLHHIGNNVGELATLGHNNEYTYNGEAITSTANRLEDLILEAFRVVKEDDN